MDLNLATNTGATAFSVAADKGHNLIVDELLRYYPHRLTNLGRLESAYGVDPQSIGGYR